MPKRGELWVFEGPDGVGKSTLSKEFTLRLQDYGIETEHYSFPGREAGTLGHLVYGLHHAPSDFGVEALTSASLQTLHIAAHLDAIENRIIPALVAGKSVVLDRFWWSTWVYGIVGGIKPALLKLLLRVERQQWGRIQPAGVFLVTKSRSWRVDETGANWQQLSVAYRELADQERRRYPVELVANEEAIECAMGNILRAGANHSRSKRLQAFVHAGAGVEGKPDTNLFTSIVKREPPRTTVVFDTYWKFAAERQSIFFRRLSGEQEPWTDDAILHRHKFTNAYRASDRVSQFLIRNVIYRENSNQISATHLNDPEEIFFRILLFKIFNRISTWQTLESELGEISLAEYSFERYDNLFSGVRKGGKPIFSSAYIMPSGSSSFGYPDKHRNYLKLLELMIEDGVPERLNGFKTMQEAFEVIRSYPTMGDFLAYQFVTDLNYSPLTDFSETEFVMPGPGARDGIAKCFSDLQGRSEADAIHWVTERQNEEFAQRGISFQSLWGRPLQLIDCQNLFCEVDKYSRVAHPEIQGISGRTRIKQLFQPTSSKIVPWYPPKWGLNEKIEKAVNIKKSTLNGDNEGDDKRVKIQSAPTNSLTSLLRAAD